MKTLIAFFISCLLILSLKAQPLTDSAQLADASTKAVNFNLTTDVYTEDGAEGYKALVYPNPVTKGKLLYIVVNEPVDIELIATCHAKKTVLRTHRSNAEPITIPTAHLHTGSYILRLKGADWHRQYPVDIR
jgi:hypothetical protein